MALTIRMKRSFSSSVMGQPQLSDGFHRLEQAIGVHPRNPKSLRDLGRTLAVAVQTVHGLTVDAGFAALVDPALFASAMPSSWRSRRRFVSNSANTPSMS